MSIKNRPTCTQTTHHWRNSRTSKIFIGIFVFFIFLYYFVSLKYEFDNELENLHWILSKSNISLYGFKPIQGSGLYSLVNVCVEALENPILRSINSNGLVNYYNETQRIVMYSDHFRSVNRTIKVSGSYNAQHNNKWDITIKNGVIPSQYSFRYSTAYFVVPTCPGNFHHFWDDEFLYLFETISQTNRLYPTARNQILYHSPQDLPALFSPCHNTSTYEIILKTLYTEQLHDVFYRMHPKNTCFATAVFGVITTTSPKPRFAVNHVLRALNISQQLPSPNKTKSRQELSVTILDRLTRRVLNTEQIQNDIRNAGYHNSRVVLMEKLDLLSQIKLSAQSDVIIGVQGAGLQWAIFMPQGSALIEIAWPSKHWGFYYDYLKGPYKIKHIKLETKDVHVNWTSYEGELRRGVKVPPEEKEKLLTKPPLSESYDNIWKHADVLVSSEKILEKLKLVS